MAILKKKTDYKSGQMVSAELINDIVETAIESNQVAEQAKELSIALNESKLTKPTGTSAQVLNGQGIPIAPTDTLDSESTLPFSSRGAYKELAAKVPTSRTINGKALSENVTLTAKDVGAISSISNLYTGNLGKNSVPVTINYTKYKAIIFFGHYNNTEYWVRIFPSEIIANAPQNSPATYKFSIVEATSDFYRFLTFYPVNNTQIAVKDANLMTLTEMWGLS